MGCILGLGLYERTRLDKKKKVKGFAYFFIMAGALLQTGKRPVPWVGWGGVGWWGRVVSVVWCLGVLLEL